MQLDAATVFWVSLAIVAYAYVGYPLLIALLARLRAPVAAGAAFDGGVSVVLAAYNEETRIGPRVAEFERLLLARGRPGEIVVVSDGSTDATAERARGSGRVPVRVIDLPTNGGKAAAISAGVAQARGELVVFADVRQTWCPEALDRLLRVFADPRVGAASGELVIQRDDGVMAGVGMYWRYEKWLRRNEARWHSSVGVSGSIAACRRVLFRPIPSGTLLDDVYWPLEVVMGGHRVVHVPNALAYDRLPPRADGEFRRKVRTLSGNFQLAARLPAALLPWRNPVWLQFLSHKLLRLVVPWALIALLVASALADGPFYRAAFVAQVFFYAAGAIGLFTTLFQRSPVASAAGSFMLLNAAAWVGFFTWITGRSASSWRKVGYEANAREPRVRAP